MKFEEKRGKFWIPSQSEAASGTLTISDDGSIRLDIDGLQIEPEVLFGNDPIEYDQVIGQIELDQFAIFKNCALINRKTLFSESNTGLLSKCEFRATDAFIGFSERPENIPCFKTLKFSIEGVDQWINIHGIKHIHGVFNTKDISDITYERPETISFDIRNDMTMNVEFGFNMHCSGIPSEVRFAEKIHFRLLSSMKSLKIESFISVAEKVRKLLCFAMNKPVSFDSVSAAPDLDCEDSARPVEIAIYRPGIYASKMPVDNNRMLLMFSNDQHDPNDPKVFINGSDIKKWIELYEEYADAFYLYFTAQTIQEPSLKCFRLAQGIEVFQRIKYNKSSNSNLMPGILDMLKESFITFDRKLRLVNDETTSKLANVLKASNYRDNFKRQNVPQSEVNMATYFLACYIRDTRNYLAHYDSKKKPKAASGDDLLNLCLKLELLLELHFLHLLGFSDEDMGRALTNLSHKREAPLDVT